MSENHNHLRSLWIPAQVAEMFFCSSLERRMSQTWNVSSTSSTAGQSTWLPARSWTSSPLWEPSLWTSFAEPSCLWGVPLKKSMWKTMTRRLTPSGKSIQPVGSRWPSDQRAQSDKRPVLLDLCCISAYLVWFTSSPKYEKAGKFHSSGLIKKLSESECPFTCPADLKGSIDQRVSTFHLPYCPHLPTCRKVNVNMLVNTNSSWMNLWSGGPFSDRPVNGPH